MISIQPQHAVNILNGKKTLELRTWIPKDYVGWVYVYVSKGFGKTKYHHLYNLTEYNNGKTLFSITQHNKHSLVPEGYLNSKVVYRFWFDEFEYIAEFSAREMLINVLDRLSITKKELKNYLKGKYGYAWHIKKLEIFDEPKSLSDFYVLYGGEESFYPLKKAPQKMTWVYVKEQ